MKPLLIINLPELSSGENHKEICDFIQSRRDNGDLEDYEILVLSGCSAKVYYPYRNWLKFVYFKLKAWLILKIWKKK